jgi:hypothetical protein
LNAREPLRARRTSPLTLAARAYIATAQKLIRLTRQLENAEFNNSAGCSGRADSDDIAGSFATLLRHNHLATTGAN